MLIDRPSAITLYIWSRSLWGLFCGGDRAQLDRLVSAENLLGRSAALLSLAAWLALAICMVLPADHAPPWSQSSCSTDSYVIFGRDDPFYWIFYPIMMILPLVANLFEKNPGWTNSNPVEVKIWRKWCA